MICTINNMNPNTSFANHHHQYSHTFDDERHDHSLIGTLPPSPLQLQPSDHRTGTFITTTTTTTTTFESQYLIRFEMLHRTFVIPTPSPLSISLLPLRHHHMNPTVDDMTQQHTNNTSNIDTDIINYIKRNIMVQIHQMHHHHHTMNPFVRTLQRHLHNIDDLVLTHFHFPFGTISLHSHLSHIIGGKGGFGTLLKGQSKQSSMNTTKNFTSCRNLQGQRLQHVNDTIHLQLVTEWKEKIQNGIATEYDMMKALTNTASGIPGWHLPLPSWSEVSIKKEMKQNQKLLHRYQREQQQQQQHKNTIQQQREQQLHHYIDTTQQWTERMEQTVSSALQRSLHKKHPPPPPLQTLKHDHKRHKVEMNINTSEDTPVLTTT